MTSIIILVLLAVAVVIGLKFLQGSEDVGDFPYVRTQGLFSPAERKFLDILEQAMGNEYRVFGKVRVVDVAEVKSTPDRRAWQRAFNRVSAKHFDFVLCDKSTLSPVCAVELDDRSHLHAQRRDRDAFVANVCKAISMPFVQVAARQDYVVTDIRAKVKEAMGAKLSSRGDR
jgi:hypothetical protein